MKDEDKTYDDLGSLTAADLFDAIWQEKKDDVTAERDAGEAYLNTVTAARTSMVKSQKTDSLVRVIAAYNAGKGSWIIPQTELLLLDDDYEVVKNAFARIMKESNGNVAFLRACPEHARHGVLESVEVTVDDLEEKWRALNQKMIDNDPNGCLILQPFIPATSSLVLSPKQFAAVAQGHDGITAGGDGLLYYILNPQDTMMSDHFYALNPKKHQLGKYEVEMVYKNDKNFNRSFKGNTAYLTQIRGSPPHHPRQPPFTYYLDPATRKPVATQYVDVIVPSGEKRTIVDEKWAEGYIKTSANVDGLIPEGGVEVKQVWTATGLEEVAWLEEKITKETMPDGFVISHPTGSMMSHICAHARQHGIPYIVSEVQVGDYWVEGSPSWLALDPDRVILPMPYDPCTEEYIDSFNSGLHNSLIHWQRQQGWLAHFFHQWVGMNYNGKTSPFLAGGFVGWMTKAILALCMGELRHSAQYKRDTMVDLFPVMTAMMGTDNWADITSLTVMDDDGKPTKQAGNPHAVTAANGHRKHYYAMMERVNVGFQEQRLALQWCKKQFSTGWSNNYGGKAWAECAQLGVDVCDAVIQFQKTPSRGTLEQLIGAVNAPKNAEHNGGFLYGKFLLKKAFDYSSTHTDEEGNVSGLFNTSPESLSLMFKSYEIAYDFMFNEPNEDCFVPDMDWVELFNYLRGKGAPYWRSTFITLDNDVPLLLREAAISCGPELMHFNNKWSQGENFIPCGIDTCEKCKEHDVVVMKLKYGDDAHGLLLTPSYPSVFLAGSTSKSSPITYAVVQLLRERKYNDVTPSMWVEAWNGLNQTDQVYPLLSKFLTKFAKNQVSDDQDWMDEIVQLTKGMDEKVVE